MSEDFSHKLLWLCLSSQMLQQPSGNGAVAHMQTAHSMKNICLLS